MTSEQLDRLDRLAAERVMVWRRTSDGTYITPDSEMYDWEPTRSIEQAWQLLDRLDRRYLIRRRKWHSLSEGIDRHIYDVEIHQPGGRRDELGRAESAPLAIVLACLGAVGVTEEEMYGE